MTAPGPTARRRPPRPLDVLRRRRQHRRPRTSRRRRRAGCARSAWSTTSASPPRTCPSSSPRSRALPPVDGLDGAHRRRGEDPRRVRRGRRPPEALAALGTPRGRTASARRPPVPRTRTGRGARGDAASGSTPAWTPARRGRAAGHRHVARDAAPPAGRSWRTRSRILPKIGLTEDDVPPTSCSTRSRRPRSRPGTPVEVNEKWRCPGPRGRRRLRAAGVRAGGRPPTRTRPRDVGRLRPGCTDDRGGRLTRTSARRRSLVAVSSASARSPCSPARTSTCSSRCTRFRNHLRDAAPYLPARRGHRPRLERGRRARRRPSTG